MLIVAPAGPLLVQWAQELRQRFGLRFTTITDAASLQQQRRKLELGGNPFDATALCMTSLDFAKQERVLEELEAFGMGPGNHRRSAPLHWVNGNCRS